MWDQLESGDQSTDVGVKCFICKLEASEVKALGDYRQIDCPQCGEYKIIGTAIALFEEHNCEFDVGLATRWLRSEQISATFPVIDSDRTTSLI